MDMTRSKSLTVPFTESSVNKSLQNISVHPGSVMNIFGPELMKRTVDKEGVLSRTFTVQTGLVLAVIFRFSKFLHNLLV